MKFKDREHVLKLATKTEKMPFKSYTHPKLCYVGKVPKLIFEIPQKKNHHFLRTFGWKST